MTDFATLRIPAATAGLRDSGPRTEWFWHGYLAAGHVTLLTSLWKGGKTTLVTGLISDLALGQSFLGRATTPSKTVYVSEEPEAVWAARFAVAPAGEGFDLLCRPFRRRPTATEWNGLVDYAAGLRAAGELDLLVVDPLASFLPGRCENDAGTMLDALLPLQRLTESGAAVLLLHHPRKAKSEEGFAARGTGALTGFADVVLELGRLSRDSGTSSRRRLVGLSRRSETPPRLVYSWDVKTAAFTVVEDDAAAQFRERWPTVLSLLKTRRHAATVQDLLADWPDDPVPARGSLYKWLTRPVEEGTVRREGKGLRDDPFRFRLPQPADEYRDRGELVPLELAMNMTEFIGGKRKRPGKGPGV